MPASNQQQQLTPAQANMMNRSILLGNAIEMCQQIYAGSLSGTIPGQQLNVLPRNVGLIKRFIVEISGTVAQGAAETQSLTNIGLANLLSQVVFTDLSNQTRVNTAGWHLHNLATVRRASVFGAAFTNDSPTGMGNNFPVIRAPSAVTTAQTFRMFYEIPLAYNDGDLRGAVYANVVNATMNLQLTFNPSFFVGSAADGTLAVYKSSTAQLGVLSGVNVAVYQVYLDQIPVDNTGRPALPILDLSTAYMLNNTVFAGLSPNQDNPISYANFRDFLSTMLIYDNNGVLNAGTDVNYFALQSANYTNIFKIDPYLASLNTRLEIGDDFQLGGYYFNHRRRPISTQQYGNMQLVVNPSSVASATGSQIFLGFESMAFQSTVTQAGSLFAT